jgi:hypothetical protein
MKTASLGLETLPERIGRLAAGMVYALACDQQAVRLPLAAGALRASLREEKPCALVTALDPRMFLRKARLAGCELDAHVANGLLTVFSLAADAAKHMFRLGPEGFLRELEHNVPGRGAFLVFDSADPLFMLSDPRASAEAAQCYVEWIARLEHTALAMFAPAPAAPRDYLALRLVAENFGGYAVVRSAEGGAQLDVRHWFAAEGAVPSESFALRTHRSGMLRVRSPERDEQLPPVDSVIYVRGLIDAEAARSWQEAETVVDAVDAARRSEAATLVLPFEHPRNYETLCRAVVTVRAMARRSLRVVVRERQMRLRASQTLALLRLGVSTIIPAEATDAAARRIVESLHGTRFARAYEMDAQHVDEETVALVQGVAPSAAAFCEAVERLLAASDGHDILSCLARLQGGALDVAALVKRGRRRGRDLLAFTHGDQAWLFLFGCTRSMSQSTLERLFMKPLAQVCSKWSAEHDPDRILVELRILQDLNRLREKVAP